MTVSSPLATATIVPPPTTLGHVAFPLAILLAALYAVHGWYTSRRAQLSAAKVRSEESRSPPRRGRTLARSKSGFGLDLHSQLGQLDGEAQQKQQVQDESPFPDLRDLKVSEQDRRRVKEDKELYHMLQNLEDHPESVQLARQRLSNLLDQTLSTALSSPAATADSILPVSSPSGLEAYFATAHSTNAAKYQSYLHRRKRGSPRELFPSREFAVDWLRLAAVVKYVDGVWVGNALSSGMAPVLPPRDGSRGQGERDVGVEIERDAAKLAWQVISEEFGDGDLRKNHVYVYHRLLSSLSDTGSSPTGDEVGFDGLLADGGSPRCWSAAVAQQCIGLLASASASISAARADFFPESLGFNMAYETLPYHLLVTSYELRELGIDDYYFALHITIDNPDSGHAAMARLAVEKYLEGVRVRDGQQAMESMWRRVKAGVILADGLPTTPSAPVEFAWDEEVNRWRPKGSIAPAASTSPPLPSVPASATSAALASCASAGPTEVEIRMIALLQRKSRAAEHLHCPSRLLIAGQTLEQWLDPSGFTDTKALAFLRALEEKRPWVVKGDDAQSRLVREIQWGGRMFGAFTEKEVGVVRGWIRGLADVASGQTVVEWDQRPVKGTYGRYIAGLGGCDDHLTPAEKQEEGEDAGGRMGSEGRAHGRGGARARFSDATSNFLPSPSNSLSSFELDNLNSRFSSPLSGTHNLNSLLSAYSLPPLVTLPKLYQAAILLTSISALDLFPLHPSKFASPLGSTVLRVLRSIHGFPDLHAEENICAGTDEDALRGIWEIARDGVFGDIPDTLQALAQAVDAEAFTDNDGIATENGLSGSSETTRCIQLAQRVSDLCADILAIRLHPYRFHRTILHLARCATAAWEQVVVPTAPVPVPAGANEDDRVIVARIRREVDAAVDQWEKPHAPR